MNTNTILIAGDLVPLTEEEMFINARINDCIDEEILTYFREASYRVCNLEAPLTSGIKKLSKCGPNLKINPQCVKGLKKLGINFVTLANNHILDYGESGLEDTISTLQREGICFSGAGKNKNEARIPFYIYLGKKKIGVFCCAESEFSIATENTAGANGFDPLYSLDYISDAKKECDYLIVLHHGGKEFYRYPSPELIKICKRMVDKGANLVICQHSHCIGCEYNYMGSKIIFGQGNFLFNRKHDEYWDSGLLIEVAFSDNQESISIIPIVNNSNKICFAKGDTLSAILSEYKKRSEDIMDEKFIYDSFKRFSSIKKTEYYKAFLGGKTFDAYLYRVINKFCKIKKIENYFFNSDIKNELYNYIACESHRELLLSILNNED